MVKAELNYNPYLLETKIKFNGQEPRINSLVEKYQQETLQNWMKKIPTIFYDEMNGYDFELEFSGTKLEYEELKKTFIEAGVTGDMVRFFHKNELDSRKSKTEKIEKGMSKGEFTSVAQANGGIENMLNQECKDKDVLALIKYIAAEDKLEKILENPQVIKTPVVRNGKQSTVGYAPEIWKKWE